MSYKKEKLRLISFLLILILFGCEKSTNKDLTGHWSISRSENDKTNLRELKFIGNNVSLIDNFLYKETASFKILNDDLIIKLDSQNQIRTRIHKLVADTIAIFEGTTFFRDKNSFFPEIEEYELIGIKTDHQFKPDNFYPVFHYYKSEGGTVKIRYDSKSAQFDDIPLFGMRHNYGPNNIIFIGKGITLKDLKKLYYHFESSASRKVILILFKQGVSDYRAFTDKIEIWRSDLDGYIKNSKISLYLPPPPDYASKEEYLGNDGEELRITSRLDFEKLNSLNEEKRFVISIDEELDFKDYVDLKLKVNEVNKSRKIEFKTEIK